MAEVTKEQMLKLHRSGVVMQSAWITYAHPDQRAKRKELYEQSEMEAFVRNAQAVTDAGGRVGDQFLEVFADSQAILKARSDLDTQLEANILTYIANGHLHGFGYELPRTVSSVPVAIPKEAWGGRCDWHKGTLSYRGLEFVDVRLTTNRIRNEILERGSVDMTAPDPVGRPSVSQDIKDAFNALAAAGEIDTTASQKSQFPKVLRWLELNRPHLPIAPKHLSNETVRKNISPLFKALKETKKQ